VRGAVSPKPSTVDYVPAVRRTYVQKIVETRAHATEVEYPFATRMQLLGLITFYAEMGMFDDVREGSAIKSSHLSQPKYAQFQSVGIKDKLNTRALQLAQLTPPS